MAGSSGVDLSLLKKSITPANNPVFAQLLQCIELGSTEVRKYLEDECDVIIECKVCRNLFRGLPNFVAHKREYCVQLHSATVSSIRSTISAAGVAVDEPAVILVCDKSNAIRQSKVISSVVGNDSGISSACGSEKTQEAATSIVSDSSVAESDKNQANVDKQNDGEAVKSNGGPTASKQNESPQTIPTTTGSARQRSDASGLRVYPCPLCMSDTVSAKDSMTFSSVSNVFRHAIVCHGVSRDDALAMRHRIEGLAFVLPDGAADMRARRMHNRNFAASKLNSGRLPAATKPSVQCGGSHRPSSLIQRALQPVTTILVSASASSASRPATTPSNAVSGESSGQKLDSASHREQIKVQVQCRSSRFTNDSNNNDGERSKRASNACEGSTGSEQKVIDLTADDDDEQPAKTATAAVVVRNDDKCSTEPQSSKSQNITTIARVSIIRPVTVASTPNLVSEARPQPQPQQQPQSQPQPQPQASGSSATGAVSTRRTGTLTRYHECIMCPSSFTRLSALKNHLLRSHGLACEIPSDSPNSSGAAQYTVSKAKPKGNSNSKSVRLVAKRRPLPRGRDELEESSEESEETETEDSDEETESSADERRFASNRNKKRKVVKQKLSAANQPPGSKPVSKAGAASEEGKTKAKCPSQSLTSQQTEVASTSNVEPQRRARTKADMLALLRARRQLTTEAAAPPDSVGTAKEGVETV